MTENVLRLYLLLLHFGFTSDLYEIKQDIKIRSPGLYILRLYRIYVTSCSFHVCYR